MDRVLSRNTGYAIGVAGFAMLIVFDLLDGDYWSAFTFSCLAASLGLLLVGAEERGGVLRALLWVFLAAVFLSILARFLF